LPGCHADCTRCRNIAPVTLYHIKEWYDKLTTCESTKRNGVAGWEKRNIGFCVAAEDVNMIDIFSLTKILME
jgi:hypothetical protein